MAPSCVGIITSTNHRCSTGNDSAEWQIFLACTNFPGGEMAPDGVMLLDVSHVTLPDDAIFLDVLMLPDG